MNTKVKQVSLGLAVGEKRISAKISSKNQLTIPVAALRRAGLSAGDHVRVDVDALGRIQISPIDETPGDTVRRLASRAMPDLFPPDFKEQLRKEWPDRW